DYYCSAYTRSNTFIF
nr:immunoglobulin light chain junction region [Macaca mulatta]